MAIGGSVHVAILTKAEVQAIARDAALDAVAALAAMGTVRVYRTPLRRLWDWLTTRRLG